MSLKGRAIDTYLAGHSSRETARLLGMSSSYVRSIIADAGIGRAVGLPGRPSGARRTGGSGTLHVGAAENRAVSGRPTLERSV